MKQILITAMLCMASAVAQESSGKIQRVEDFGDLSAKQIASEVERLSLSKDGADRILAANVIAFFPALISSKTEIAVVSRLAEDPNPKVKRAALDSMRGLIDVALIKPFLPIVKKMQSDPNTAVSQEAKVMYLQLKEFNASFEKKGLTDEVARKKYFTGGVVPELY